MFFALFVPLLARRERPGHPPLPHLGFAGFWVAALFLPHPLVLANASGSVDCFIHWTDKTIVNLPDRLFVHFRRCRVVKVFYGGEVAVVCVEHIISDALAVGRVKGLIAYAPFGCDNTPIWFIVSWTFPCMRLLEIVDQRKSLLTSGVKSYQTADDFP